MEMELKNKITKMKNSVGMDWQQNGHGWKQEEKTKGNIQSEARWDERTANSERKARERAQWKAAPISMAAEAQGKKISKRGQK